MSEDSMRCRRAPELTFETGDELSRHKEALKVAIGALRELGLDYAHFTETVEKRVAAVLAPAPEFEQQVAEIWAVIDTSSGRIWNTGTKDTMEFACDPDPSNILKVVQLTGPYLRPVKRPVVREVEVEGVMGCDGLGLRENDYPFLKHPECHGRTGTLIFRWLE